MILNLLFIFQSFGIYPYNEHILFLEGSEYETIKGTNQILLTLKHGMPKRDHAGKDKMLSVNTIPRDRKENNKNAWWKECKWNWRRGTESCGDIYWVKRCRVWGDNTVLNFYMPRVEWPRSHHFNGIKHWVLSAVKVMLTSLSIAVPGLYFKW